MQEKRRKCTKCGSSPADDPTIKLHRFPQRNKANKSRCELWAKFCFPNDEWQSPQFQNKLYSDHKMICDKHFKSTSSKQEKHLIGCNKKSSYKGQDKPNVEIVIQEHSVETRNKLKRSPDEIDDSPKKIKYEPEECAEMNDSPMRTKGTLYSEPSEKSQDNFDDSYELFHITSKYEQNDDCSLYGKLLTKKLRTYSVYERNLLMYKIDGLLIENPPGFNTTPDSNLRNSSNKTTNKVILSSKKKVTSTSSAIELHSYATNSEGAPYSAKKTRVKKESISDAVQISSSMEEFNTIATQVTSTSVSSLSPVKTTNDILNQPAIIMSSNVNQPAKVTSSKLNHPVKVNSIQYQPIKVSCNIPSKPVTNSNQTIATEVISSSLPMHLPLQITIPETKGDGYSFIETWARM